MIYFILVVLCIYYFYRYLIRASQTPETRNVIAEATATTVPPIPVPKTTTISPRHRICGMVQNVNWCNDLTKIFWPHIGKIVESLLSPTLEPLINLYLPKPFSRFRFIRSKLGKDPLEITGITVHHRHEDAIAMDVDVKFIGHPNISMRCAPLSAPFGIKELRWEGTLSVLLRPLLTHLPLVGAIQASMITPPDIDMNFTGVANVADFGPIAKIVKLVLRNVISSMLVLPNRFNYITSDVVDYFSVYQPPIGVINIKIERGRKFTKEKKIGLIKAIPDLYCTASFSLENMKTEVEMNNLTPEWGKSKSFILSDFEQPFHLECYDKDTITLDDLVGTLTVDAKTLLQRESGWYKLTDHIDEKIAKEGEIYLTAQLYDFRDPREPVRGQCVFSILIDRAKNLPTSVKTAAVKVTVGTSDKKIVRETPQVINPVHSLEFKKEDTQLQNPDIVWNFSFDVLCDDYATSDVTFEVYTGKRLLGNVMIDAAILEATDSNVKEAEFQLGGGAMLRAKVILRGLIPGRFAAD